MVESDGAARQPQPPATVRSPESGEIPETSRIIPEGQKDGLTCSPPEFVMFPEIVMDPAILLRTEGLPEHQKQGQHQQFKEGKPIVRIGEMEWRNLEEIERRFSLIGNFLGDRPPLETIRASFKRSIPLTGDVRIGSINSRRVLIRCELEEDCKAILARNQVKIEGRSMRIRRWSLDWNESSIAAVWVLLPNLPIHLFNARILSKICAPIGSLVTLDSATRHKSRPSVAKAMVEIDLLKPLIEKFWIDFETRGFWQKIGYEFVPLFCGECSRLGHSVEGCRRRKSGENRPPEVVVAGRKQAEEGRRRGSARLESHHGEGEEGSRREEIGPGQENTNLGEGNKAQKEEGSSTLGLKKSNKEIKMKISSGSIKEERLMTCEEGAEKLKQLMDCDEVFGTLINETLQDLNSYMCDETQETDTQKGIMAIRASSILLGKVRGRLCPPSELERLLRANREVFGEALYVWATKST